MALIAVPDNRLVTSELHLNRYVRIGVRVLIQLSPFLILSAPLFGSTSVFSNVCLGNRALQFPCLLTQPLHFFAFSHQQELKCDTCEHLISESNHLQYLGERAIASHGMYESLFELLHMPLPLMSPSMHNVC